MAGTFRSIEARAKYIRAEAIDVLRRDLSYSDRRQEIARARWRAIEDGLTPGPSFSLLEAEVRSEVNGLLNSVDFVATPRHLMWLAPSSTSMLLRRHIQKRPMLHPLLCFGADGTNIGTTSRFDDLAPPVRFDSITLVGAIRPAEADNDALLMLGGSIKETKEAVERVIFQSEAASVAKELNLMIYVLLDGGGIYKWLKRRARCGYDLVHRAVLTNDPSTTLRARCTATAEDLQLFLDVQPECIVGGLLHGLCTIFLRLRKRGLDDNERTRFDTWFQKLTGHPFVRGKANDAADASVRDGKLEIEKLDTMLSRLAEVKQHIPCKWHRTLDRLHHLRFERFIPSALLILTNIHLSFLAHTDGGWTVGCHFVAHSLAFAIKYAKADMWVIHEQLVERANQLFKRKARHWSGDALRVMKAHNVVQRE